MTVPPPVAQGSPNGTTWTDVGTIVPSITPTIVPQGTNAVLQLGPSTFCYDNAAGSPAYTRLRVGFCAGTPQSAPVILGQLPAPQDAASTGTEGLPRHRARPQPASGVVLAGPRFAGAVERAVCPCSTVSASGCGRSERAT